MKGFWKRIAASASITAVFVICALALAFSSVPVTTAPAQASRDGRTASLAGSLDGMLGGLNEADEKVDATEPALPVVTEATVTQPAPATAAPKVAPVDTAPPAPAAEAPLPQAPPAQPAAPPGTTLNPPAALSGTFVPDIPARIELTWDANNSPSIVSHFIVYREEVGQTGLTVARSNKSTYKDGNIVLGSTYRYWVTAVSKSGEESGPSNTVEVATLTMEAPSAPGGVTAAVLDPGVSIDWQPNTEPNLAGYNVYLSQGGRWRKLTNRIITENHYYYGQGTTGQTYAVSAVNVFGMESAYTVVQPQPTIPVLYEESDPAVSVEGFWAVERYEGASGGSIIVAETAGARLHFAFTGRQVKLLVAKYWTCGNACIYIDGQLMATISLYSYDPVFQSIEVSVPGLKYGAHVLTVEVVGAGNPEGTYNFVNVDAFEVR